MSPERGTTIMPVDIDPREAEGYEGRGMYHNLAPTSLTLTRHLLLRPLSTDRIRDYRNRTVDIRKRVSPTLFLPWALQAFPYAAHKRCCSSHMYFLGKLSLVDILCMKADPEFKEHGPGIEVASVWIAMCPSKGSAFNYIIGNKAYRYSIPLLANYYELFAVPDQEATFIVITASTPSTAYAVVAKVTMLPDVTIDVQFKLFRHPDSKPPEVDHLSLWSYTSYSSAPNVPPRYLKDGGMLATQVCGSFPTKDDAPYDRAREIVAAWKEDERLENMVVIDEQRTHLRDIVAKRIISSTAADMQFALTKREAMDTFEARYEQIKQYMRHSMNCVRYAVDTPYFCDPFFYSEGVRDFEFPPRAEIYVKKEGQYLQYKRNNWSTMNDPEISEISSLSLHLHHQYETGIYDSNILRPKDQSKPFSTQVYDASWQYELCKSTQKPKTKATLDWLPKEPNLMSKRERAQQREQWSNKYDEDEPYDRTMYSKWQYSSYHQKWLGIRFETESSSAGFDASLRAITRRGQRVHQRGTNKNNEVNGGTTL